MIRRNLFRSALALAACAIIAGPALADDAWPSKPIRLIVPFPPGGTSDVMGRMVAEGLGKALKQPVIVENLGGQGGVIGTTKGVRSAPDGYTLIMTGVGQNAVAHGIYGNVPYDSDKDFVHVGQIHIGPNVLIAHPGAPFKTFREFVEYVRANPGKLNYGYTYAASGHMAMELLKQTASECPKGVASCPPFQMNGVPYKGGGPLLIDLLGGQIPLIFINQDVILQHVKAGKVVPLAVSTQHRNPLFPDVPTVAEMGFPGFEAISWSGISLPKGTPKPIVDRLEAEMTRVMQSPEVRKRMEADGFVIPPPGAKAYADYVHSEKERWVRVIKAAGIKAE